MCHLPPDFAHRYLHEFSTRSVACLRLWYWYLRLAESEEGSISDGQTGADCTYVEDHKDSVEVRPPRGNHVLIIPRMNKSRESITPALLYDLPPYFLDGPAIEGTVGGGIREVYCRFHSHCQLIYRITHGSTEVIQALSVHSLL